MGIGSSGGEGLAASRLTSSLEHSTLIAPMLDLTVSVQPVLHSFFTWSPEALSLAPKLGRRFFRQPSDAPMLRHRFFRCYWFLQNSSNSVFLWVFSLCFVLYGLFTSSLQYRNVHSTKTLVPLITLSYDHQNHSKWHKWCHVRYKGLAPSGSRPAAATGLPLPPEAGAGHGRRRRRGLPARAWAGAKGNWLNCMKS